MKKIGNSPGNEEKFFGYVEIGSQKPDYFSTQRASQRLLLQLEALNSTLGDIVTTIDNLITSVIRFDGRFCYSLSKEPEQIRMPHSSLKYQSQYSLGQINHGQEMKRNICERILIQLQTLTSTMVDMNGRFDELANNFGHFGDKIRRAMFPDQPGNYKTKERHYKPDIQQKYAILMHEGKKTVSGVARELMTTELTVRRWKKNYEKKLAKLESIAQSEHN